MACDKLGPRLTEYFFEEIDEAGRRQVEEHVASCEDCKAELALLESTISLVREAHHLDEAEQTLSAGRRDAIRQAASVADIEVAPEPGLWKRWRIPTFSLAFGCTALLCFVFTFDMMFSGARMSRRSTKSLLQSVSFSRKRERAPQSKARQDSPRPTTKRSGGRIATNDALKNRTVGDESEAFGESAVKLQSGLFQNKGKRSTSAPVASGPRPAAARPAVCKPAPGTKWSFAVAPGDGASGKAMGGTGGSSRVGRDKGGMLGTLRSAGGVSVGGKSGALIRTHNPRKTRRRQSVLAKAPMERYRPKSSKEAILDYTLSARGRGDSKKKDAATKSPDDKPTETETLAKGWNFEKRYERLDTHPFLETAEQPKSTFAVDVDTASYTQMRSYLYSNVLPPPASVRVEEYVNFFDYEYAPPDRGDFTVHAEASPSPYREGYHLLRIGLKAREVDRKQRRPARLTFVVDVSGSMASARRLPLVRRALRMLVGELGEGDLVGIITYGTSARVQLPHTPATRRQTILNAISRLKTNGSTNAEAGLTLGYAQAAKVFAEGCSNRVILCSDGMANTGRTRADAILAQVRARANKGIFLTTVGFGMGSYNDRFMERLADRGNGVNAYVDGLDEARRIFVESLTSTLETIARDAKIQVAWNPGRVHKYRLLGYENRALRAKDFRDDAVDAGEIGAGHAVTAVYEIKLKKTTDRSLATLRVRYKAPRSDRVVTLQEPIKAACLRPSFATASPRHRLAVVVCQYAEILRKSYWAKGRTIEDVLPDAQRLAVALAGDKRVEEFARLVKKAYEVETRKPARRAPVADQSAPRPTR